VVSVQQLSVFSQLLSGDTCCILQHMTVSDVILEATKRLGIDTSYGLVSAVCTNNANKWSY